MNFRENEAGAVRQPVLRPSQVPLKFDFRAGLS